MKKVLNEGLTRTTVKGQMANDGIIKGLTKPNGKLVRPPPPSPIKPQKK